MSQYPFEAVIFDCDGVLVDTERLANRVWKRMLAGLDLHLDDQELHFHFTGHTTAANLVTASKLLGAPLPDGFHDNLRQGFLEEVSQGMPMIPYIQEALDALTLPKATATNAMRRELMYKLEQTGLNQYFHHYVCVEDVERPKPAPDIYLYTAELLGVPASMCAVVEDSPAGIKAATAAGMTVFAYSADMIAEHQIAAGAAATFDDMRELNRLIQSFSAVRAGSH
ncbi:phosphatase [Hahella sp. CCB-MM4]|uniref:HAD family hydrolase n=1 Tax=Hahella sp. (strain CCB-MM4) TaxID=1926491 RepID=UPI000B9A7BC0|nr:HAD family phosphatase [Hahella sp. CCB-MM4]OZG71816.1 phosphatase [Hahella sp. CCB-MM4]